MDKRPGAGAKLGAVAVVVGVGTGPGAARLPAIAAAGAFVCSGQLLAGDRAQQAGARVDEADQPVDDVLGGGHAQYRSREVAKLK